MNKEVAIQKAKELKNEGKNVRAFSVGAETYIVSPITMDEYFQFRLTEPTFEAEKAFVSSHFVDENPVTESLDAGTYERIKDALFQASGFSKDINILFDPLQTELMTDVSKLTQELIKTNPKARIIMVNRIPFAIRPITTTEYMQYKTNGDQLVELPRDEAYTKAYAIDKELVVSHLIYPTALPEEAGYLEMLFQALWQISGFAQDVEIIEV